MDTFGRGYYDTKEIIVHDCKISNKLLTLLIFDLNNRVVKGRSILLKDKVAVLGDVAKTRFMITGTNKSAVC